MAVVVAPSAVLIGGRYRVDDLIGVGGMGRVYRGMHVGIRRPIAIKLLQGQPDPARARLAAERFQREAFASGQLDHPNIVAVSDFGVLDDGSMYLVMEVLEGESLGARLSREQKLPWRDAIDIMLGVLAGIQYAHDRDIVHCDLKPDNIFIASKHGEQVVKVLDFGIARLCAEGESDEPEMTIGTPAYLSPEQAVGAAITPASDLYSAGIVFYELLTGYPPFCDPTPVAKLAAHVAKEPPPFPPDLDLPPGLEAIVRISLNKSPSHRLASASEFRERLEEMIRLNESPASRTGLAPNPTSLPYAPTVLDHPVLETLETPRRRHRRVLLAVTATLAAAGVGFVMIPRGHPDVATAQQPVLPIAMPTTQASPPLPFDPRLDGASAAIASGRITSPTGGSALELIAQMSKDRPDDPRIAALRTRATDALRSAAEVLWTHGKRESAATIYSELLRLVPTDATARTRSVVAQPSASVRVSRSSAESTLPRVRWLVSQVDLAIIDRRFVAPSGHNALEYLMELRRLDPNDDQVGRLGTEVSTALKQEATREPERAESLLAAAKQASPLAEPVRVADAAKPPPAVISEHTRDPSNASLLVRTGAAAFAAGHLDDAERAYQRAIASDSESHAALAGLADVSYDRAAYARAVLSAKRAVAIAPSVVAIAEARWPMGALRARALRPTRSARPRSPTVRCSSAT